MDLTTSTFFVKHHRSDKMREFARQRGNRNPIDVGLDKLGLERRRVLEEERASKEAREKTRVHESASSPLMGFG